MRTIGQARMTPSGVGGFANLIVILVIFMYANENITVMADPRSAKIMKQLDGKSYNICIKMM